MIVIVMATVTVVVVVVVEVVVCKSYGKGSNKSFQHSKTRHPKTVERPIKTAIALQIATLAWRCRASGPLPRQNNRGETNKTTVQIFGSFRK